MKTAKPPKLAPYQPARIRLSRNLVRVRGELGISQEELADRAGLHRTYVGHLEQRKRNPSLENVERIALTLNVDILDLLAPTQEDA